MGNVEKLLQLSKNVQTNFCKKARAHDENLVNIKKQAHKRKVNGYEKKNIGLWNKFSLNVTRSKAEVGKAGNIKRPIYLTTWRKVTVDYKEAIDGFLRESSKTLKSLHRAAESKKIGTQEKMSFWEREEDLVNTSVSQGFHITLKL